MQITVRSCKKNYFLLICAISSIGECKIRLSEVKKCTSLGTEEAFQVVYNVRTVQ